MPKYFLHGVDDSPREITLCGDTAHHILRVLRMREGACVTLCDGANTDFAAVLREADVKNGVCRFEVTAVAPCNTEPPMHITVFQALPKGDKLDGIIQKCVELGAARIIPIKTARTEVKIANADARQARRQKIAEAAAGQSMRGVIPKVEAVMEFAEAVAMAASPSTLHLLALAPSERAAPVPALLRLARDLSAPPASIALWVGPEGGFTAQEIAALEGMGARAVSLGARVLRTETAAPALLAQIAAVWEDT